VKPPSTIKVGPFTYRVEVDDAKVPDSMYGVCDKSEQRISLHKDQSKQRLRLSLLHEVLHALCDLANLDDDPVEERIVTQLSPVLLAVLLENPKLTRFLLENSNSSEA
jgi:hypothetical protein